MEKTMLQRMTVPAIPTIETWSKGKGWFDAASCSSQTGYAYTTVKNTCEWLVMQRKLIRDGAPYERSKPIKYHAITDYFGGFRLD